MTVLEMERSMTPDTAELNLRLNNGLYVNVRVTVSETRSSSSG
jgi:hypothetical protein